MIDNVRLLKIIRGMQRSLQVEGHGTILSDSTERDLAGLERYLLEVRIEDVFIEYGFNANDEVNIITKLVEVMYGAG